jgi:formamidase
MKTIKMDYGKSCAEESRRVHNRWHPGIPPAVEVEVGEEVELETRDAFDGQITAATQAGDLLHADFSVVHPLTGPVFLNGA